jgi:hypothetical protein
VPGAPRLAVLLTTPAVAEDVAAECAAAGVPPASGWTAPRPGSMLKKAVACHREHGIVLIPARSGSAATVAMCKRHDEEQMPSPTVLPIDGSRSEAKADRAAADFRKSSRESIWRESRDTRVSVREAEASD